MLGIVPTENGYALASKLLDAGLATAPSVSNVIRLLPPLNITINHIDKALQKIRQVLEKLPD